MKRIPPYQEYCSLSLSPLSVVHTAQGNLMGAFTYVYILVDVSTGTHHYCGLPHDLKKRLAKHNEGGCPHTAPYKPWRIETALAFSSEAKARAFERYLKSHSGRAFADRHF